MMLKILILCAFFVILSLAFCANVQAYESCQQCVDRLCGPPCDASRSACENCYRIDVPRQCGVECGRQVGGGAGGRNHLTILVNGNNNEINAGQRNGRRARKEAAFAPLRERLREKRGWAADFKADVKNDLRKNNVEIQNSENHNEFNIQQKNNDRAKRGWAADFKADVKNDLRKNNVEIQNSGNHNEFNIQQKNNDK